MPLLGRLLDPGRDRRDELQALHRIGKAAFRERLSRCHREHRSRKVRIFLCRAMRGELFISTPAGSLVLGSEPLGFLGLPLRRTATRSPIRTCVVDCAMALASPRPHSVTTPPGVSSRA
jgi:hypothetical protein